MSLFLVCVSTQIISDREKLKILWDLITVLLISLPLLLSLFCPFSFQNCVVRSGVLISSVLVLSHVLLSN